MSRPKETSFVVLGLRDGQDVVLFEDKVFEVALKQAESLLFTGEHTNLRIAQLLVNMSLEPKDDNQPVSKAVS